MEFIRVNWRPGLWIARGIDDAVRHVAGRPLDPVEVVAGLGSESRVDDRARDGFRAQAPRGRACRPDSSAYPIPRGWNLPHRHRIFTDFAQAGLHPVTPLFTPVGGWRLAHVLVSLEDMR